MKYEVLNQFEPSFVSLFCGCGGFDLGFVQAGYKCLGAYDIDPVAIGNHQANLGTGAIVHDLLEDIDSIEDYYGVDVVLAGPPCQGFSTVGKRRLEDPRNKLILVAGEIAIRINPKVFIVENVRGIVSGEHKRYWDDLHKLLWANGYKTKDSLVSSDQLGLAQARKRMVLVAWRADKNWDLADLPRKNSTLKDALSNIDGLPNHNVKRLEPNSDFALIAKHIQPGQKLCNVRGGERSVHTWNVPEVYGETTKQERYLLEIILRLRRRIRIRDIGDADPVRVTDLRKEVQEVIKDPLPMLDSLIRKGYVRKVGGRYDITHAFNGKFRRLKLDKPSLTVDTRFTDPRYFLHPTEDRGFTVREAARIQGFPDSYIFRGSEKDQCRLIGNAVPPPLAKWLAESVIPLLE